MAARRRGVTFRDMPRIVVFGPDPLLTVAIERRADGSDELHLHAGGLGVWAARMVAELGGEPVLCGFVGGETGAVVQALLNRIPVVPQLVHSGQPTGSYVADRREVRRIVAHAPSGPRTRHEIDELISGTCAAAAGADALLVCNP